MDTAETLDILRDANSQTLEYFNEAYITNLELVQSLKTELFELEVQIETLEKTKNLYNYQPENRRNVFSPRSARDEESMTRGRLITSQIKDLNDAKERLTNRITELEEQVHYYKEQAELLHKANKCLETMQSDNPSDADTKEDVLANAIEFIESEDTQSKNKHIYNMLKFEDYDHYQFSSMLDQTLRQELISELNKLDVLKWLLHSDVDRARTTLDELQESHQQILSSLEHILDRSNYKIDPTKPILTLADELISSYRQAHPECKIDITFDCARPKMLLSSVITIRTIRMLQEIFENVFQHSNANEVTGKITITNRLVDVDIHDNGIGIPEDYLDRASWSSGLHRIHEIIYQLDGSLQIEGNLVSGTNIRFSFPVLPPSA